MWLGKTESKGQMRQSFANVRSNCLSEVALETEVCVVDPLGHVALAM
jgi:hypothetical protein